MSNNIPVNGWPRLKDLEAVQPTLDRLDKIEAWKRTVKEETFTGSELTIENALALPARSLITSINAIQDLHGLPFPYVGGAYKNKLQVTATTQTKNGYTLTFASDGTFSISGTPTSTVTEIVLATQTIPSGDYKLNGCGFANDNCRLQLFKGSTLVGSQYNNNDLSFTSDGGGYKLTIVVINAAGTLNNQIVKPMIRLSTESDASFAPYSNVCPISGRTEVAVERSGINTYNPVAYGYISGSDGSITEQPQSSGIKCCENYIPISSALYAYIEAHSGTSSNYAYRVGYYDVNKRWISNQQIVTFGSSVQLTIPTNCAYYRASSWEDEGKMMLSPEPITAYVAPQITDATIQLGTTVYGAEINWDTGVMTVTDAMVTFDGSDDEVWNWSTTNSLAWIEVNGAFITDDVTQHNVYTLNNIFEDKSWVDKSDSGSVGLVYGNSRIYVKYSGITSVADAKALFASTNLQVCYELTTPTTLQLTPTQLEMLKGHNRVTLSDGYGTIELKALTGANWS